MFWLTQFLPSRKLEQQVYSRLTLVIYWSRMHHLCKWGNWQLICGKIWGYFNDIIDNNWTRHHIQSSSYDPTQYEGHQSKSVLAHNKDFSEASPHTCFYMCTHGNPSFLDCKLLKALELKAPARAKKLKSCLYYSVSVTTVIQYQYPIKNCVSKLRSNMHLILM